MKEIQGDLWEYYDRGMWVCITTNGFVTQKGKLVMGRGCAKEARDKLPGIDRQWGTLVKHYGNIPFELPARRVISFPVKRHFKDLADLELIEKSANAIKRIVETYNIKKVIIPRPGCGWGYLEWEDVKPVLERVFTDDRFVIISFPEKETVRKY
jgi:hypothetical protein